MANIYDIAKEAGVSKSTVSRVINNKESVSEEKREKVLEVIKRLNYKPNSAARRLGLKKTNTIGVLVSDLSDNFYSEYVRNINDIFTNKLHYGALYCTNNEETSGEVNYLELLNKSVDGYIFLGERSVSLEDLKVLQNDNEPFVGIGINETLENATLLDIDNHDATYEAVKYLHKLNHRRIGYLYPRVHRKEFYNRYEGYKDALKKFDLDYEKQFVTGFLFDEAYESAGEIAKAIEEENLTAIVCYNDTSAMGIIDGLIDLGYTIPDDLSVIGYDDIDFFTKTNNPIPPLTTLRQPNKEMAEYGVNALYNMIQKKEKAPSKIFHCELITRSSTKKLND